MNKMSGGIHSNAGNVLSVEVFCLIKQKKETNFQDDSMAFSSLRTPVVVVTETPILLQKGTI